MYTIVFIFLKEFFYFFSISLLLLTIIKKKSCIGISGRSQILFAVAYTAKDLDILSNLFSSESVIKLIYVCLMYVTVLVIFFAVQHTYQREKDVFLTEILIIPSFIMALWVNYSFTPIGIIQTFCIYLESVAILPQFYMILEKREVRRSLISYLIGLGLYKTTSIIYWLCLYQNEGYFDPIASGAGLFYTFLYLLALIEYFFIGIKVIDDRKKTENFLNRNIFFISTREPVTDHLNLISNDQLDDKKEKSAEEPLVEKI